MLLSSGLLEPGEGTMAIEYLGQRFVGDLLPDGKIKSQETDIIFASPSAWAIHCKRIINPDKKSGCGWASVKYKGRKLDVYKNAWFRKKKEEEQDKENRDTDDDEMEKEKLVSVQRIVKHNVLGIRSINHDPNTLVESTAFSSLGKIQPFLVSMSTNAVLVMDFHCHLTTSEVVGYLGGHWDVNAHNLAITHAFPCKCRLGDREMAPLVEADIYRAMEQRHLTLVGWYHSHPFTAATPTLRDIDAQLEYEIKMKGNSDASYTPCVGVICSPYNKDNQSLESAIVSYWVMPPPESKPHDYGKPMLMSYSVVQDQFLSQDALNEMKRCVDFYRNESDFINFSESYRGNISYLDKLKTTLSSKFPRDQSDGILWSFICDLVCPGGGATENGLSFLNKLFGSPEIQNSSPVPLDKVNLLVPSIPMASSAKSSPVNLAGGNMMMSADIAAALFGSGKFPSPTSLMGLSAEASRSLIGSSGISNMFMPPLGFKMDNISLLKPLTNTVSNPVASTSKASSPVASSPVSDTRSASPAKTPQTEPVNLTAAESTEKNSTMINMETT
ncbi:MPN domain-containing protein isoform X1 [Schistocerca americana]|uniref:MPN domain-containing protein isoform X1 n=1 Tax=Schistocerca americana TaxID=7009 RepID=UPI001F5022F8|nr:MPN domain-containing protein isoform X1 [Schistocerca americana]XP_049814563.1 MPN domain-containing protein isoform X2 [Schistocerca nitens]